MDRKELEELIRLVEDSDVQELHIRNLLTSVRIVKAQPHVLTSHAVAAEVPHATAAPAPAPAVAIADTGDQVAATETNVDAGLVPITSPMVGTYYAASSPDSAPYVNQGDHISKGQVVGIIEAMKLMNEIESEVAGTSVRIVAENGKPIEFGSSLFMVQPD